jgi:anthranilate synthase component 2
MKVLVLDNYDSFTYNLVQYIEEILDRPVTVRRNDQISLDAVAEYDVIILSPGPGVPSEAGIMPELIRRYAPDKHILGVCLGHQAIAEAFGGSIFNLEQVYHGIETPVRITDAQEILFQEIPQDFIAGRYHSWVVRPEDLPDSLLVTATAADEEERIMAIRHRDYQVRGVQFHPESIMTEYGRKMLENFFAHVQEQTLAH